MKATYLDGQTASASSLYAELLEDAQEDGSIEYGVYYQEYQGNSGESVFVLFEEKHHTKRQIGVAANRLSALHFLDRIEVCNTMYLLEVSQQHEAA